jgi:hypothetical protein
MNDHFRHYELSIAANVDAESHPSVLGVDDGRSVSHEHRFTARKNQCGQRNKPRSAPEGTRSLPRSLNRTQAASIIDHFSAITTRTPTRGLRSGGGRM